MGSFMDHIAFCTAMSCFPPEGGDGEVSCNTCGSEDPVFMTGILNIVERCGGREIVAFQDGEQVDRRISWGPCKYHVELFGKTVLSF